MGERRNLLGTSAVLVGLGSALITGTAVAAADTGDGDTRQADRSSAPSSSADDSATTSPAPRRTGPRARTAPAASGADIPNGIPAPAASSAARAARPAAAVEVAAPAEQKNSAPVTAPSVPQPAAAVPAAATVGTPETGAAVTAPVTDPAPAAPVVAVAATPAPAIISVHRGRPGGIVVTAAPAPAAAYAAPAAVAAPAQAATQMVDLLAGLGWLPSAPVVATPALAAFTGQLPDAQPAAVVGAPLTSAAPPDPKLPGLPTNGVTGVQVGHSQLEMPGAFIGKTVPADWYFPTQADGSVKAQGVIWLQHGFAASNTFYSALATDLAQKTNSIVVAPTLSSIPFTFSGGWLNGATSQEAAAEIMLDPNRTALVTSAQAAGFTGDVAQLKGRFVLSGHSAGGGFASAVGSDYISEGTDEQDKNLIGVVMFDGVSNGTFDGSFTDQVKTLVNANKPIYQIAAPSQIWNAFGATTNQLLAANPGAFDGVVLVGGSHVDSMLGVSPLLDVVLQLVAGKVPAGNTAATYALSTGWINDFYAGATPQAPQYGLYAGANQQIIFGPAAGIALPTPTLNQVGAIGGALKSVTDAIFKLFGIPPTPDVNTGTNGVTSFVTPPKTNGVTGVKTGSSTLVIPSGNGYDAPADWYFPTQADGSVQPNGVIWLQHGFLGFKEWYADMAYALAQETNSIVVVPQIFWFDDAFSGQAAAEMFTGTRPALNVSANAAGFQGTLPKKFILTGHSAGGRFATTAGAGTVDNGAAVDLLGVVMFDGVDGSEQFAASIAKLQSLGIPDYQIAALAQRWNAWGGTTEQLAQLLPGQFIGTMIDNGSHTDSIGGDSFWGNIGEIGSDIFVKPSPPGAKAAVRTFATGWINDFYSGVYGPDNPGYGIYGNPNDGTYVANQTIVLGEATSRTLPAPPPIKLDPALPPTQNYLGTWYEQASVKQFFSLGLVNTKAVYSLNPDGSVKVQNSGNYFGPNGPQSSITGSAVVVNGPTNTRLNVGFGFGQPSDREPGNYWILDYGPNYEWAIVSDSSGLSGFILTRDQTISQDEYNALVERAKQLGVRGWITQTKQFPPGSAATV